MDEFEAERQQGQEAEDSNLPSRSFNNEFSKVPESSYVQSDDKIWNQNMSAKVLLQLKNEEVAKLRFIEGSYRPIEYEKWIMSVNRLMKGFHPEIGVYWKKALMEAENTYFQYLKDVSSTRVSLQPKPNMELTEIEVRIENRVRTLLMNAVPVVVTQQCIF